MKSIARMPKQRTPVKTLNVSSSLQKRAAQTGEPTAAADRSFHFGSIAVHPPGIHQPKLAIHNAGDVYEQEADRIAEQVMHMPGGASTATTTHSASANVQRKCACGGTCSDCNHKAQDEEEHAHVQKKATPSAGGGQTAAPPIVHEALQGAGQPLDAATRAFMEPRFGHDFSRVRVHTDSRAADSASAIQAQAYTVGENVVFAAGHFNPHTKTGKHLLGHELVHVVQQRGTLGTEHVQRQPAPAGAKQPPPAKTGGKKDQEEEQRQHALDLHVKQLRHVALCLDKARKLKADPNAGTLSANNIYRNVVEMLDTGKLTLTILTPTHYSTADHQAYFDVRAPYPRLDGTYTGTQGGAGIDRPTPGESGATEKVSQLATPVYTTMPKGPEHVPGETTPPPQEEKTPPAKPAVTAQSGPPKVTWTAAEVRLYLPAEPLVTDDELRALLVHEGVHVADWSHLHQASLGDSTSMLEEYKTEFRAYWLQPEFTSSPDDPLRAQQDVTIMPDRKCVACPPPRGGGLPPIRTVQTDLKNKKQAEIFFKLISGYTDQQYDCFYVCDSKFKKGVDDFAHPAGKNLIASARIVDLEVEFRKLTSNMTRAQVQQTDLLKAVENLDALDWAFLNDTLSAPFWELFAAFVPDPLVKEMRSVAKKSSPKVADIDQAFQRALAKIKLK